MILLTKVLTISIEQMISPGFRGSFSPKGNCSLCSLRSSDLHSSIMRLFFCEIVSVVVDINILVSLQNCDCRDNEYFSDIIPLPSFGAEQVCVSDKTATQVISNIGGGLCFQMNQASIPDGCIQICRRGERLAVYYGLKQTVGVEEVLWREVTFHSTKKHH